MYQVAYNILSRIIYYILFLFFLILDYIHEKLWIIKNKYIQIFDKKTNNLYELKNISRTLNHITFLLGPEEPCYENIADLIVWCLTAEIPYVSFYDAKGKIQQHYYELKKLVDEKKQNTDSVLWQYDNIEHRKLHRGKIIRVKIFSDEDGRSSLANLCKQTALEEINDIDINYLDKKLYKNYEFPEPELGVIFGKLCVLLNYSPWHIRLTEFFHVRSHYYITFKEFFDILCKYNRCDRREGK